MNELASTRMVTDKELKDGVTLLISSLTTFGVDEAQQGQAYKITMQFNRVTSEEFTNMVRRHLQAEFGSEFPKPVVFLERIKAARPRVARINVGYREDTGQRVEVAGALPEGLIPVSMLTAEQVREFDQKFAETKAAGREQTLAMQAERRKARGEA